MQFKRCCSASIFALFPSFLRIYPFPSPPHPHSPPRPPGGMGPRRNLKIYNSPSYTSDEIEAYSIAFQKRPPTFSFQAMAEKMKRWQAQHLPRNRIIFFRSIQLYPKDFPFLRQIYARNRFQITNGAIGFTGLFHLLVQERGNQLRISFLSFFL